MFKIKITNKKDNTTLGYFCGIFELKEGRTCGYEEDINNPKVKPYKLQRNTIKAIESLIDLYGENSPYNFESVEV